MLLVIGIFLTLLSYLGSVIYHSQNHGFGGITVDNSYHGYGDNTVESNDIRISEMRNAAAVLDEHSLPNSFFEERSMPNPFFEERSQGVGANEEIYSEHENFVSQLSYSVDNEIENEIEGVVEIEKEESNEETREEEDEVATVEVREEEVEIEVEMDRLQNEMSFDSSLSYIQSSTPLSSSSSLTAPHTLTENMNTDRDINRERESDTNEESLSSIELSNDDNNIINDNNDYDYEINSNEIPHNSQRNIQMNENFNVPFPENISDSSEINGIVSEEKIRKFLFLLLKSFEHLHSSDCSW